MDLIKFILVTLLKSLIDYGATRFLPWIAGQFKWWKYSPWFKKYAIKVEQFTNSQRPRKPLGIQRIGKIGRFEKNEILQGWQANNQIILTGTAGSGKTGISWQIVEALKEKNELVLYLDCSRISINQEILKYLQLNIDKEEDVEKALKRIGQNTTLYCVLDQLDHLIRSVQPSNLVRFINKLSNISGLRILVVVRDFEFGQSKELKDIGFPVVRSQELQIEDATKYLEIIGMSNPPDDVVGLARNLFNLSLIADIYASGKDIRDISGQIQLLDRYIEHITLETGGKTIERAIELAGKHMASPQSNLEGNLSEPAIRRLLSRGILITDQLRRLRFRHEVMEEYICAYGLLPDTPELSKLIEKFGESSARRIISWLIGMYHEKSPHDEIVLTEAGLDSNLPFYFKATILDAIRFQQAPTEGISEVIARFLQSEKESYAKYFFQGLDNPVWVELLHHQKYFHAAPPPEADPHNPGFFSLPDWYAGEYLKTMASSFPEIVVDVALNLHTENARAIQVMLKAIIKIPPELVTRTVGSIERWANTSFAGSMMLAHEMGLVLEYLAKGEQVDAALHVLNILIEPTPIQDRYLEGKVVAGTPHDLYWLNEVFSHNLPSLLELASIAVANTLEKRLIEAIDLEVDPKIPKEKCPAYSYWRLNIRPDLGREQPRDFKDLLVNVLIHSLEVSCEQRREEVIDILSTFLDSPYAILKRIAVYLLRIRGDQYPDLVEKAYRAWEKEGWAAGRDEFEHFLDAQFGVLPARTQEEILADIFKYMDEDEFAEWAERAIEQAPDNFAGNIKEEKKTSFTEEYEFRQLHRFAQWLTGKAKNRYVELSTKYEKPAPRPESGIVIATREIEQSPIDIDTLAKMTVQEAIQYLVDFVPEGEGFRKPSREGLVEVFKSEVKNRLDMFVENSPLLIRDDLRFIYHESYLRALTDAIKSGQKIRFDQVIDLFEFILSVKEDKFEKQQYEPDLSYAKLAVANLLEQFLRTREPYIDNELLARIGQVILILANEEPDPFLDQEIVELNPIEIDIRTLNTNLDAATQSLNSIRGVAMHCLISYALYSERKRKAEGGDKDKPIMIALVRDALTEKLDKERDSSQAVHAVLGWYFPQLMYLDKEWAVENLEKIFPLNRNSIQYWIAAWSAYIRFSDVCSNVFVYLVDHYRLAIDLLPNQKAQAFDRIDESLAEHLLKAYLRKLIDIDSEDGLLKSYYDKATDEIRSHGNFWLSKILEAQKPDSNNDIWIRTWNLWQWRLAEISEAEDKDKYQEEISSFSRLLDNVPVELDVLYSLLSEMIRFKSEGRFEVIKIIEYLAKNAEKHLKYAVGLLLEIIQKKLLPYLTGDNRNDIRIILEQVKNSDDTEVSRQAVEMINTLGEWGDYEWGQYLSDIE
jgi:hypothetical protein